MYMKYYYNYCSNTCVNANRTDNSGVPYQGTCSTPVASKCYVGIGPNSNSGNLTTCISGYNYCQVIYKNKLVIYL